MLYYNFSNFEQFKEIFGIQQHGNGQKSRKNKILLTFIKNRQLLHDAVITGDYSLLHISDMTTLKKTILYRIRLSSNNIDNFPHALNIKDNIYRSPSYKSDEYQGLCEDGDFKSYRYINVENNRVFKMKMGKLFRKIILDTTFGKTLPEQVVTYLCEEASQEWQTYAIGQIPRNTLTVNKDFKRIYDSDYLAENFSSCMIDKNHHSFYENAVDASAAYIQDEDGQIVARCIIFNKVTDQNGKIWRLAERQYSKNQNDVLKRALVDALIAENHIDGYKTVGAGCHDARAFVDREGNSLSSYEFSIECNLDYGDTVSYQDSFKYYDINDNVATNYGDGDIELDTTDRRLGEEDDDYEDDAYDDYHDTYCEETTTVYRNGVEYQCNINDMDDFIWVDSEDGYYHTDEVYTCDKCGDYYLSVNTHYSELTDMDYCCSECLQEAEDKYKEDNWTYSEYDEKYYEDEEDVVTYRQWRYYAKVYVDSTISRETLDELLEEGLFYCIDDIIYDSIDGETELPFGEAIEETTAVTEAA